MISLQILREFALFKGLDDNDLAQVAELCRQRVLSEGDLCFSQGRKASELHLCRSGTVNIIVRLNEPWSKEVVVHIASTGEVFGWSALVEPHIYTASAKCAGRVEELYIRGADLVKLFEPNPRVGYILMCNLGAVVSSRLTESREKLTREIAASTNREW